MDIPKPLLAVVASLLLSGCASLYGTFGHSKDQPNKPPLTESWVYTGVKSDGLLLMFSAYCAGYDGHGCSRPSDKWMWLATPAFLIDAPLSFVADTLLLPYTLHKQHKQGPGA